MHFKIKAYNFKEKNPTTLPHFPGLDGILVSLHFLIDINNFQDRKYM